MPLLTQENPGEWSIDHHIFFFFFCGNHTTIFQSIDHFIKGTFPSYAMQNESIFSNNALQMVFWIGHLRRHGVWNFYLAFDFFIPTTDLSAHEYMCFPGSFQGNTIIFLCSEKDDPFKCMIFGSKSFYFPP